MVYLRVGRSDLFLILRHDLKLLAFTYKLSSLCNLSLYGEPLQPSKRDNFSWIGWISPLFSIAVTSLYTP